LLHALLPNVLVVVLLVKSDNPNAESTLRDAREAARSLRLELHPLKAQTATDIDTAFASLAQQQVGAPDQFEARIAHDGIARAETKANERLSRAWAEVEDRVIRLKTDLAQA
jgi:hypothetical protein